MQLFCCTTTKKQAKRLFFLFPIRQGHRGYAGRTKGKHPNPMFKAKSDEGDILHPNAPETIGHKFGRSIFLAPTTNGATYELEWSNTLSQLPPDAPVFIQVLRHKSPKAYLIIVRPSKHTEINDFSIVRLTHANNRGGVKMKGPNGRSFVIREDDIHQNAWAVWANDDHKFDGCAHFDGEQTTVWEIRKEWLSSLQEGQSEEPGDQSGTPIDMMPRRKGHVGQRR